MARAFILETVTGLSMQSINLSFSHPKAHSTDVRYDFDSFGFFYFFFFLNSREWPQNGLEPIGLEHTDEHRFFFLFISSLSVQWNLRAREKISFRRSCYSQSKWNRKKKMLQFPFVYDGRLFSSIFSKIANNRFRSKTHELWKEKLFVSIVWHKMFYFWIQCYCISMQFDR